MTGKSPAFGVCYQREKHAVMGLKVFVSRSQKARTCVMLGG